MAGARDGGRHVSEPRTASRSAPARPKQHDWCKRSRTSASMRRGPSSSASSSFSREFAAVNGGAGAPRRGSSSGGSAGSSGGGQVRLLGIGESVRALQSEMRLATEAYVAILGQLNEVSLRFLDATRWWRPPEAAAEHGDLRLPDVAPGGRVSARLWLHNTTAAGADGLRPWCPGLASHSGASLPDSSGDVQPQRIDRLDAGPEPRDPRHRRRRRRTCPRRRTTGSSWSTVCPTSSSRSVSWVVPTTDRS